MVPWGPFTSLWHLQVWDDAGPVPLHHDRSVRRVSAEQVSLPCRPSLELHIHVQWSLDNFYQKVHISNLTFLEQLILKLLIFCKFPDGQWIAAEFNQFSHSVMKGLPRTVAIQLSSVAQSGPTLCDPMNRSTPGCPRQAVPVHHQLLEFTQTHVHQVGDAIQPSHPLSSPSYALNLSQH